MRRRLVVLGSALAVVAVAVGGWLVLRPSPASLPTREAEAWLRALERNDTAAMTASATGDVSSLAPTVLSMHDGLDATAATFELGHLTKRASRVTAPFTAHVQIAGLGEWRYDGSFALVRGSGTWKVDWSPADLHPALAPGLRFSHTRDWPTRAPILGVDGNPLVADSAAFDVGVQPSRIKDQAQLTASLQQLLGVDPGSVVKALTAPGVKPDHFVAVKTLRPADYTRLRPQLEPIPGVVFQKSDARLGPTDAFGLHVLGRVAPITAERLQDLGAPYLGTDRVGMSGLEASFERQLAGRPSGDVRLVDAGGRVAKVLGHLDGAPAQQLATTIDARVQQAAETALAGVSQPAALVAVDAPTGQIRAVVSMPLDQPFDRALAGLYPPGSTFKVVTTAALVENGLQPGSPTTCPPTAVVGGRPFSNFEGEAAGPITLDTAFAISCNTAFVDMADRLPAGALGRAAAEFGFNERYDLPLPVAGGRFPDPGDQAARAAAAIGQAKVEASPLQMAGVAATADAGAWRAPRLLTTDPTPTAKPLDPGVSAVLRQLMGDVVTSGTGTAAAVPGPAVSGKTGTAEFGPANPPATHAWFIGYRGDLAFSVLVEGGGVGGQVAAPLAATFLKAIGP